MTTPPDTPQRVLDKLQQEWLFGRGLPSDRGRVAEQVLDALTAAGYRIIRGEGLEHGDALELTGWSYNPPYQPSWRRVVGNEQDTP